MKLNFLRIMSIIMMITICIVPSLYYAQADDLGITILSFRLVYEVGMTKLGEEVLFQGTKEPGSAKLEAVLTKTSKAFFYFVDDSDLSMIKKISHIGYFGTEAQQRTSLASMYMTIAAVDGELGADGINELIKRLFKYESAYTDHCHYNLEYNDSLNTYILDMIPYKKPKGRISGA